MFVRYPYSYYARFFQEKGERMEKAEQVEQFVRDNFENVPMWLVNGNDSFQDGTLWWGNVEEMEPMWGTAFWFERNYLMGEFVKGEQERINDMGFSILYDANNDDEPLALGIDGAGYDFYENHWRPLFDLFQEWL